jgi:hypothetical protein
MNDSKAALFSHASNSLPEAKWGREFGASFNTRTAFPQNGCSVRLAGTFLSVTGSCVTEMSYQYGYIGQRQSLLKRGDLSIPGNTGINVY